MKFRRLGDSDLEVSEISLGSWLTYSGGVGREQTEACTRAAFEAGINFFDTANVYGRGAAEEAWGEILSGYRPQVLRARDQDLLSDVGNRPRPLRKADRKTARRLAAAAANRLRRPLSVPPLRRRDADRGDDGGADRRCALRQGATHRVQRVDAAADPRRRSRCPGRSSSSPPSRSTT